MSERCEICGPECFYPEQHKPENIHVRMATGDGKQQEARTDSIWPDLGTCKELSEPHAQRLGCKEWQPIAARQASQSSHASGEQRVYYASNRQQGKTSAMLTEAYQRGVQAMAEKAVQQLANIWIGGMTAQEVRESFLTHVRSLAGAEPGWKCGARAGSTGANDPQDCDWPTCGCDPHADKVIEALQEGGHLRAVEPPQDKLTALVAKWRKIAAECPSKYRNKWRDVFEAVETCANELDRSLAGAEPQPEHDEIGDRDVGFMPVAVGPPQDKGAK